MKFVLGENGRNPAKNLPRPRFVHHETHMEGPRRELGTPAVGGERLTACAKRPNTNNNANPAAHSLNIIPTKFGTLTVNSFLSTLTKVAKV